jgi:hypothetical protein
MRRIAAVCFLGFFTTAAWCSMPTFWRYSHPEAKALIGIEWSRILNSPIGQQVRQQMNEAGLPKLEGMEFLDDVERVLISSPGNQDGTPDDQPPAVIAVQGRFDFDKLRAMAAAKMTGSSSYGSVEILEQRRPGETPLSLALVNPATILLGDSDSVTAAIDHQLAADPAVASDPLFRRATELAATNDLWIVASASPADFSSKGIQPAPFLNDIESIEAGLSLQQGLGLQLNLGADSEESARNMAAGLQMMLGMFMASQGNRPGMPDLGEKLRVSADGSLVKVALSLDESELEQGFTQLKASMMSPKGVESGDVDVRAAVRGSGEWSWASSQTRPAQVQPASPQEKKVIRIYGLEEGAREVPFPE